MSAKSRSARLLHSLDITPTKTPVGVPANERGSIPASSIARHDDCNRSRCWGSSAAASIGAMPKKSLSNASTASMKWPRRVFIVPGAPPGW